MVKKSMNVIITTLRYYIRQNMNIPPGSIEYNLVWGYIKKMINLFKKMKRDNAILPITLKEYELEFDKLKTIHLPSSIIYHNFISLGSNSGLNFPAYNNSLTVINPSNGEFAEFTKRHIILLQCWLYTTNCELILRLFKKFIDFRLINRLPPHSSRIQMPYFNNTLLQPDKITLGRALHVLKRRYNTYLFKDIDIDLRNKISHYDFKFLGGGKEDGIYFHPDSTNLRKKKIYYIKRLSILNKKISLLYAAIVQTNRALLFLWNGK